MAMSKRREARFEVVVEQGGKPNIDGVFDDEKSATERANFLLRLAKFPVVRVVKVTGTGREETIFQKTSSGGAKLTNISPIDSANLCTDVLQVFSFDSRMTLLRLLRGYWDDQGVIPSEQLHRYYPLRYFEREALLFNPSISRLATLQAPMLGVKPHERYDQLSRLFATLKDLAQKSDTLAPFDQALMRGGVSGLLLAAVDRPAEERDRIVTHAFGTLLEPHREWGAKLTAVLRLHNEEDGESTRLVDEFAAEITDGREPIRALIGYSPDLASAILALLAALRGDLDDRLPHTEPLLALSNALASDGTGLGFARTREALLNRIRGGLDGLTPLTRTGAASDARAFSTIVDGMIAFDGYMGGPAMAESLTRRGKTVWATGGSDLPFEETMTRLAGRFNTAAGRLGYLLDLGASPYGHKKISVVIQRVADEFNRVKSAAELAAPGASIQEVREGLGRRLRAAGIPRALADGLIAKIAAIPDDRRVSVTGSGVAAGQRMAALPAARPTDMTVDMQAPPMPAARLTLSYQGRTVALRDAGEDVVIGRAAECGIVLDHASASRRHAVVRLRDGAFTLEDLSRNGTRLVPQDGEQRLLKLGDVAPLSGRGEIVIGSLDLGEHPARIAWDLSGR
ncbi:Forkhead associated (FHA) domain, binds pSer, pThr, pTyr [Azospirillum oryzae]|uniref:Forkhead associated (FHA) domain, binds pSer, pThr, pTyr n=1 Tax=Azospirillum oryzae TaxID=286727 RepID=A0A1X7HRF8_9PROT|nr:FHA domain-containing protein [Azospirillum oryzae]SMF91546.1 Forkhead associated (FHA) domain, binds pSer, pThr, pTyr [Azospirillum oryzae]